LADSKEKLIIKKRRGEDGNKLITLRIHEELLAEIDRIASEANYSRNELVNIILEHGVKNLEII
jgi:metal-responsive CopG/Arc/MetJ family transcriptional regulator